MLTARTSPDLQSTTVGNKSDDGPTDSTTNEILRAQVNHLSLALKEKEEEANHLRAQLKQFLEDSQKQTSLHSRLENELAAVKSELEKAEVIHNEQTEKIAQLGYTIQDQNDTIDTLRRETQEQLRTIVSYEIDLETHQLHYTGYADQQAALEKDAMDELEIGQHKKTIEELEKANGCRIQQLISTLIVDRAEWERRYKQYRADSTQEIQQLTNERNELIAKVEVFEQRLEGKISQSAEHAGGDGHLFRRISQLENANAMLRNKEQVLQDQIFELRGASSNLPNLPEVPDTESKKEQSLVRLTNMNKELLNRIASLRMQAINAQLRIRPLHMDDEMPCENSLPEYEDGADLDWEQRINDLKLILRQKDYELKEERARSCQGKDELLSPRKEMNQVSARQVLCSLSNS